MVGYFGFLSNNEVISQSGTHGVKLLLQIIYPGSPALYLFSCVSATDFSIVISGFVYSFVGLFTLHIWLCI